MTLRYIEQTIKLELNNEKCAGCGMCIAVCPHQVFEMKEKKAEIVDRGACMECGACKMNCPAQAIEVKSGVGCAYAIINGMLKGTEPSCDCGCDAPGKKNNCC